MKKLLSTLLCMVPTLAMAGVELDAYHFAWTSGGTLALPVGGPSGQMLAQTFEAEHTAPLARVDLVIACFDDLGQISVEIQKVGVDGLPNGGVHGGVVVNAGDLLSDEPAVFEFPIAGVSLSSAASYAIVVSGDQEAKCVMPQGAAPMGVGHAGGEAFGAVPPAPPDWMPVDFSSGDDFAFWVYVHVSDLVEPRYCDIANYSGLPVSWVFGDVPLCSCVSDTILLHNRCWFTFPDWVVWRNVPLPWEQASGKADWWVVAMNSDFPGLSILESDIEGFGFSDELTFDAGLKAGKSHRASTYYQGQPSGTLVDFYFEIDGEPVHVQFETLIDVPAEK